MELLEGGQHLQECHTQDSKCPHCSSRPAGLPGPLGSALDQVDFSSREAHLHDSGNSCSGQWLPGQVAPAGPSPTHGKNTHQVGRNCQTLHSYEPRKPIKGLGGAPLFLEDQSPRVTSLGSQHQILIQQVQSPGLPHHNPKDMHNPQAPLIPACCDFSPNLSLFDHSSQDWYFRPGAC